MAVSAERVTVGTDPTALNSSARGNRSGSGILLRNRGAASIFVGDADVTAATGYEVPAGDPLAVDLEEGEVVYAVTAAGTVDTHVLRVGA